MLNPVKVGDTLRYMSGQFVVDESSKFWINAAIDCEPDSFEYQKIYNRVFAHTNFVNVALFIANACLEENST